MPGHEEETLRKVRHDNPSDDPDREPRPMDRGPSPDAGVSESLGIRPAYPDDEEVRTAGDLPGEEIVEDR